MKHVIERVGLHFSHSILGRHVGMGYGIGRFFLPVLIGNDGTGCQNLLVLTDQSR